MEIRKNLVHVPSVGMTFSEPSLTQQHFKDDCDIDRILKRYDSTGFLVDPMAVKRPASWGDFSNVEDYQASMNRISRINEYFDSLPAGLRQRFGNDAAQLAAFLSNEQNYEEAVKLGLLAERPPVNPLPEGPSSGSLEQPPAGGSPISPSEGNPA